VTDSILAQDAPRRGPPTLYTDIVSIRAPEGLRSGLTELARRKHTRTAELVRQILISALAREGIAL
jgi:hypothetical protein